MKKFLGLAISTLMVGSMLIGCGGSADATTTEAAVEATTEAAAAEDVTVAEDVEAVSEDVEVVSEDAEAVSEVESVEVVTVA